MLTELLEKRNAIVLSDFDRTVIKEHSILNQLSANFKRLNVHGRIKFMERLFDVCARYRKDGLEGLYSLFEGCPVEVLDETIKNCTFNERWRDLVEEIGVEEITIVSRNNKRIIEEYFKSTNLGVNIVKVLANELEVEEDVYTGRVKVVVSRENLAELVTGKMYICGKDEKKLLKNCPGINFHRKLDGLYLCNSEPKTKLETLINKP